MINVDSLKEGDFVKRISNPKSGGIFDFTVGKEYEVHVDSSGELYINQDYGGKSKYYKRHLRANYEYWEKVDMYNNVGEIYLEQLSSETTFGATEYQAVVAMDKQGLKTLEKLVKKSSQEKEVRHLDYEIKLAEEKLARLKAEREKIE